jgi:hypothetical protein
MNLFAAPTVPAAAIAVGASAGPALGADGSTPKLAGPTAGANGQPRMFQVAEPRLIRSAGNLRPAVPGLALSVEESLPRQG